MGACQDFSDVQFEVRSNGVPSAGQSVLITLPSGFTWADGTPGSTRVFTSDANGLVTVAPITAGAVPGTATITATVLPNGPTAGATVEVAGAVAREFSTLNNFYRQLGGIPLNSAAIAWNIFLAPNGDLFWYDSSASPVSYFLIDSGVTSAVGQHYTGPHASQSLVEVDQVTYVAGGVAKTWQRALNAGAPASASFGTIAGAVAVGGATYLAGTTLYHGNTVIATGVTSAVAQHYAAPNGSVMDLITYVDATGGHTGTHNGTTYSPANNFGLVPAGSTAVGWNTFLAPNGNLWYYAGGAAISVIASNIVSATAQHGTAGGGQYDFLTYVNSSNVGTWRRSDGASTGTVNLPGPAKAKGWRTFLTDAGQLYYGATLRDTGVQSANGWHEPESAGTEQDWLAWTALSGC
ncbi:hypothetical protein HQQ81_12400 [Microbacteriaceae bacterium VKM Ac-2854]|nr:hypothetical protein [Microbacteriaceae bacterium VKM Ac-2854]